MNGEELKNFLKGKGVKFADLARSMGISPQHLNNIWKSPSLKTDRLEEIQRLTGINIFSLLEKNDEAERIVIKEDASFVENSNGNVYKEMSNGKYKVTVPLIPYRAHAKYIEDCFDQNIYKEYEVIDFIVDSVGRGKYVSFEIKGDSMDDESKVSISDGDLVLCREVGRQHWGNRLHFGQFPYWIIVHKTSIICKQIINQDIEKGIITCHSLNPSPEYPDFDLRLDDIKQLFNIIKVLSDRTF